MDIYTEIQKLNKELYIQINELSKNGEKYARAYTNYRVALAKELLLLKKEGFAITLAGDIARGKPEIAELKFQEISSEAIYKANLESVNAIKLNIKILQNQYDKEWGNADNNPF